MFQDIDEARPRRGRGWRSSRRDAGRTSVSKSPKGVEDVCPKEHVCALVEVLEASVSGVVAEGLLVILLANMVVG